MKKTILTILITAIICITGTVTATYVYTARDIGYSPSDESWNVTNASEALSSLKEDLNNVNTNVTEYKQQITEALADKGVEVDENSSMEDITNGIATMSSDRDFTLVLTVTAQAGNAYEAYSSYTVSSAKNITRDVTITRSNGVINTSYSAWSYSNPGWVQHSKNDTWMTATISSVTVKSFTWNN